MSLVVEELSCLRRHCVACRNGLGTFPIILFGNEEQKENIFPISQAEVKWLRLLTEADAGSDAAGIRTTAVLDGDSYVLNGTKQWITNGGEADIYTVIACTNRR